MRVIRYLIYVVLAVLLVTMALANGEVVTLHLLPPPLTQLFNFEWSIPLPMFVVVLGSLLLGIVLGFTFEWVRERKHRRTASRLRRENRQLTRSSQQSGGAVGRSGNGKSDDVLALLE